MEMAQLGKSTYNKQRIKIMLCACTRNAEDFISKITSLGKIPERVIIAKLDVTSLYTNNPNQEGILAVAADMQKDTSKGPIANHILDLLKLVLHNMYLEFKEEFFLQIGGTAMGTALAPELLTSFMDRFETKALKISTETINMEKILLMIFFNLDPWGRFPETFC